MCDATQSTWLKLAIETSRDRDPVDALVDIEALHKWANERLEGVFQENGIVRSTEGENV